MNSVKDDPDAPAVRQRLSRAWTIAFTSIAVVLCITIAGASPLPAATLIRVPVARPKAPNAAPYAARHLFVTILPVDAGELLHEIVPCAPVAHIVWMEVTAYCPCTKCCGPSAHGVTASGKEISFNRGVFVAADTDVFPFNTCVSIPGYNGSLPVEVIDRGSAIKGNHLDVFFPTHEQAVQWGRRRLPITISR